LMSPRIALTAGLLQSRPVPCYKHRATGRSEPVTTI
jgi:hypothetical protein